MRWRESPENTATDGRKRILEMDNKNSGDQKRKIIIGSRESLLAMAQTCSVQKFLMEHNPDLVVEILPMKTTGDKILDRTLDKVGGKGLFVKELDKALTDRRSDLSVHSLKDVPAEVDPDLPLLAFSRREDPRDVLVLPKGVEELDRTKPLGSSSQRRILQLKALFPDMEVKSVRGNLQTRLRKLDEGEYSGLILAAAGLKRMGLEDRISRYFSTEEMIPAAGQGILAIQGRKGEDTSYLKEWNDEEGTLCALAERAFIRELDGGCSSPIAAFAKIEGDMLTLSGLYYTEEDQKIRKGAETGRICDAEQIGKSLAVKIIGDMYAPGKRNR